MTAMRNSRPLRTIPLPQCLRALLLVSLLVFSGGCLEFRSIEQPASVGSSDTFTVQVEVAADGIAGPDDDFLPHFGVRLPSGWTIPHDALVCTGVYDGTIVYDPDLSQEQEDLSPAPEGYYWWVGSGDPGAGSGPVFSDIQIKTDGRTGSFSIDYMLGNSYDGLNQQRSNGHWVEVIDDVPAPTGLQAVVEGEEVSLSWSAPQPSEGLVGYLVYRDEDLINANFVVDTSYSDDNPGVGLHTYTVASFYSQGNVYFALNSLEVFVCAGGTGDPGDPLRIATAEQLIAAGSHPSLLHRHYVLVSDIDLDPNLPKAQMFDRALIAPDTSDMDEGFQGPVFTGTFDGNGHTISNLEIEGHSYLGLFGAVGRGAQIVNVNVVNAAVTGNGWHIGAITGTNGGTLQACDSSGVVMGYSDVGGLVGSNYHAFIIESASDTDVVGIEYVGGLVGSQLSEDSDEATIYGSNATGSVFGWHWVGGLVGFNQGTVSRCSSDSFINGSSCLGGLVGYHDTTALLSNCYSHSTVQGEDRVGGLVGVNAGSVRFTYSAGQVTGVSHMGGLVGRSEAQAEVISSFWDMEVSGQSSSDGGLGVTTAALQELSTYLAAGWDFAAESEKGTEDVWYLGKDGLAQFFSFKGMGTLEDPYLVDTVWHLMSIGSNPDMLDKHFKLTTHIDLDPNQLGSRTFTRAVIAPDVDPSNNSYDGVPFSGVFDGGGCEIRNMRITGAHNLGLFGLIGSEAQVTNLSVVNAYVEVHDIRTPGKGGRRPANSQGILAGANEGVVQMCHTGGSVTGCGEWVGGLIGYNLGHVAHCTSSANAEGGYTVGGLVGYHHEGQVTVCYSTGTVEQAVLSVSGASSGKPSGDSAGGLVGDNDAHVGRCYATGNVNGRIWVGGLVGANHGRVEQCYSTGSVVGRGRIGGLVGGNREGEISESYSVGAVTGDYDAGGLVGWNNWSVTQAFWDTETSAQSSSAGGVGVSTAQMHNIDTFLNAGWDFLGREFDGTEDIWVMETYPVLFMSQLQGKGTMESPYLISEQNKLVAFRNLVPSAHYRLTEDIDLQGILWEGPLLDEYFGTFDGNGFSIRNLTIAGEDDLGLFGRMNRDATIKNLALEHVSVEGSGRRIGGLVGRNEGLVTGCQCTGVVTGASYVAGLVGLNEGQISDCSSTDTAIEGQGQGRIGGIAGSNSRRGQISNCYSTASVIGGNHAGGIVGRNDGDVMNCQSHATVSGGLNVGGIVGRNSGDVTDCHSAATVNGWRSVGGLLGSNSGTVNDSLSDGKVHGSSDGVGGLVGSCSNSSVNRCYSTAQVSGDSSLGGLVGSNHDSSITACYSAGPVSGETHVGGLVGHHYDGGSITASYSTGLVSGTSHVGGLVGESGGGVITSFWDMETTGQVTSEGGRGLMTSEMQDIKTFLDAGWSIEDDTAISTNATWYIHDGQDYPALTWESRPRCASFPHPQNGTVSLSQPLILTWQVGTWAAHHDVYFGDNKEEVGLATTEDMEVYQGRLPVERNTYDPGALMYNTTYYWRIDELTEAQSDAPCSGPVWQFSTADFIASHSPANRTIGVDYNGPAILSWASSGPALWYDVYFGDSENAVAQANPYRGLIYRGRHTADQTTFNTGDLQPGRTYFWRIDGVDSAQADIVWMGQVRQFTTKDFLIRHSPTDHSTGVARGVNLSWVAREPGRQYDVYFGEDQNAVAEATQDSAGIYRGQQLPDDTTYDPGDLKGNTTYFWRVDAVDDNDPKNLWQGEVWQFTTTAAR